MLAAAITKINKSLQMPQNVVSEDTKFSKFNRTIQEALIYYKEIYNNKNINCQNKN